MRETRPPDRAATNKPFVFSTLFDGSDVFCQSIVLSQSLDISYGGIEVTQGKSLTCQQTASTPRIQITGQSDQDNLYSLLMIDRQASRFPGAPQETYVHYWVGNIPGTRFLNGDPFEMYVRPSPHDLIQHTYEFLLYSQQQPIAGRLPDRFVLDFDSLVSENHLTSLVTQTSFVLELHVNPGTGGYSC
ncbi:protein FLOWERING LOCUS T-like [Selaginella moellendorffii]|uniref:protein FLOWERING LOCUS T-like n=1 Tax=Selaginella moellendorffii TaxID=88036 RepID=UPI000D1CB040|nr:protein FLOWERING LOCUS T-like [Selaginella moellendorffii]|eukprot:XP_024514883.1 protein FLOWERING LOCUS T-like [Selaginella moellendorffii]